jgi:branched-chain amino acid transport system ATP-binding protein
MERLSNKVTAMLEVENITKSFGGLTAINHLSLSLNEGEILGIIGPNGSGKTTLFNLITGLIKPDSGRIVFMNGDITGGRCHEICCQGIARTFQLVKPFLYLTTLQNVMAGRLYGKRSAPSLKMAAVEAEAILEYVGLKAKKSIAAKSLTLPDRKRLEVARALATKPKILLLDEVMAGLNPTEAENAMSLIRKIRDSGITIMLVEHVIKAVIGLSDRIIAINAGEKIAEGSPQQVINDKRVIEAYLGEEIPA